MTRKLKSSPLAFCCVAQHFEVGHVIPTKQTYLGDSLRSQKLRMGYMTLTAPLSLSGCFAIGMLGLIKVKLHTKCEVSVFILHEYTKSDANL